MARINDPIATEPEQPNTDGAPEADPGSVPVEAHVRSAPGTRARDTAVRRVTDLEAELMRLQLAIVQTDGEMKGAHLQAAREYIADVLEQVVEGKRRMPRELADHLAKGLNPQRSGMNELIRRGAGPAAGHEA